MIEVIIARRTSLIKGNDIGHIVHGWCGVILLETNKLMQLMMKEALLDRYEAGYLLSRKLDGFKNGNSIIVGIPNGGLCVAAIVAETLSLPLEIMMCRKMVHPGDGKRTIGSVSQDEIFIHDSQTIPQDYVAHQILLLRNAMNFERKKYCSTDGVADLRDKEVILVDDVLNSGDTIMACLRSIRKQTPLKIIVAVPIVTAEAARVVRAEADELIFLKMANAMGSPEEYFQEAPCVDEAKINVMLRLPR
jgi:putative phosphoribosyl transferase